MQPAGDSSPENRSKLATFVAFQERFRSWSRPWSSKLASIVVGPNQPPSLGRKIPRHQAPTIEIMPQRSRKRAQRDWKDIVNEARTYRDESMTSFQTPDNELPSPLPRRVIGLPSSLLSPAIHSTTSMPLSEMLESMSNGSLPAVTVAESFLRAAALAQNLVPQPFTIPSTY
jgi:hypothetical protein